MMTVSRALRRQPGVSPEVQQRVLRVAESIGYRPNPLVQTLMEQVRTGRVGPGAATIALLMPQFDNAAWGKSDWLHRIVDGVQARAKVRGFHLEIFRWTHEQMSDERLDRVLKARGVRGVVIAPLAQAGGGVNLDWSHFAAAAIGASMTHPKLHRVRYHAFHGAQLAVQKLQEAGCRRIGLAMAAPSSARVEQMWEGGFIVGQPHLPLQTRGKLVYLPSVLEQGPFLAWLRKAKIDGLVVGGDNGRRIYEWLKESGKRVPTDVAIAFLNLMGAGLAGAAGIDQEFEALGATGFDMVVEQCYHNERGIPAKPRDVLIDGRWIDGFTVPPENLATRPNV